MKVEAVWKGINIIPENYQDKYYLATFFKNASKNNLVENMDLFFSSKDYSGYYDWTDIYEFDEEVEESEKPNSPVFVEDIVSLEILYTEL